MNNSIQQSSNNLNANNTKTQQVKTRKMKTFISKNAMALAALAIAAGSYGLMSFDINERDDEMLTFEYHAPIGDPAPYSKTNVENLDNWQPTPSSCPTPGEDAACTIEVPEENTLGNGSQLDPNEVELQTSSVSSGVYKVDTPSPAHGYSNPANRSIP